MGAAKKVYRRFKDLGVGKVFGTLKESHGGIKRKRQGTRELPD